MASELQPTSSTETSAGGQQRLTPIHPRDVPDGAFTTRLNVRFSHCDPAGLVYTPRFIDIVNGVIEDFFIQELNINYHDMIHNRGVGLGYAKVDCDFFRPAFMGDRLAFTPLITHLGRCSAIYSVHCFRALEEVMRCRLVMVTTSLHTNQAISMPTDMKAALSAYRDNCR